MDIKELLTHVSNYSKGRHTTIKYLVLHYTANNGDTALGNCKYFSSANRNASAHYFVDEKGIYRSVRDMNVAWHCGSTNGYKHKYCRNTNSIGIEMCSRKDKNGRFYIKKETVINAIELTNLLDIQKTSYEWFLTEGIQEVFVVFSRDWHHGNHDTFSVFPLSQVLPDLFRDERHERVK